MRGAALKFLLVASSAAASLAVASTADAAVVVTVPNTNPVVYTPPTSGGLIGQVAANSSSNDSFIFYIAGSSPALFSGQLSTTSLLPGGAGNINFTNIMIDGVAGLFTLTSTGGAPEQWSCCQPGGNGVIALSGGGVPAGQHTLSFTATNTSNVLGTYSGTFNFGALPEPGTWAMMLLGFGGIGLTMRRRRRPVLAQIA